jgi:glutathione synthase
MSRIVVCLRASSKGDVEFINEDGGHLLRTKTASSDEGGVAAGFAVLDSPYLS